MDGHSQTNSVVDTNLHDFNEPAYSTLLKIPHLVRLFR